MAEYLSPGVYVEEYDNAPRGMEGVGTSTAGFVGLAEKGSTKGAPVLITNYAEFLRRFGGYLSEFEFGGYRYLAGAVEQFFLNGGTRCYVARVIPGNARAAMFQNECLNISAANEGSWGNRIVLEFTESTRKKMQLLEKKSERVYVAKSTAGFEEGSLVKAGDEYNRITTIFDREITFEQEFAQDVVDPGLVPEKVLYLAELEVQVRYQDEVEVFSELSLYPASRNEISVRMKSSEMVKLKLSPGWQTELKSPVTQLLGEEGPVIVLSGGQDGTMEQVNAGTFIGEDLGPGVRTGIQAFLENSIVSIMAVPGITMPDVMVSLVAHCENTGSRFAVLDMPQELSDPKPLLEYRELIDSTYAAMYHPWIQCFDRTTQKAGYFPPSGAVLGVYSRTDIERGVHKAPANETVSCSGLQIHYTKGEQDILNPEGVNLIRALPGQGIRIWGARTASSNASFRYVNIRRLFIFVEESIKANTNWVVFEPNDTALWNRVRQSVSGFLNTMWRNGMFAGATPEESYFVDIGPSTMTEDDIRNGRLICNIGIAPSRPAEFVIFRVTQHTADAEA